MCANRRLQTYAGRFRRCQRMATLGTSALAGRLHRGGGRGLRRRDRRGCSVRDGGQRPGARHLRRPAAVHRDHRRADQARGRGRRGQQGRLRSLGAAGRHPAAAVLRAARAGPEAGAHTMASAADPAVPEGLYRNRGGGVLRHRLGRLPCGLAWSYRAVPGARVSCRRLAPGRGCGQCRAVGGQRPAGAACSQGRRPHYAYPGHAVRTRAGLERRRRAVRRRPGHPGRGFQPAHDPVRAPVRYPAPAFGPACPASQRVPGRLQDGPAQRGDLGTRSCY